MLFRIKEKIRNLIIVLFMAKKNDVRKNARVDFSPENYQKKHIANSSIITMYYNEEQTLFFRECRRHQRIKPYLLACIEDYFDNICSCSDSEVLKEAVLSNLANKENYKKAIHITEVFHRHLLEILSGVYRDYSATGFPCFAERENNEEFIAFIKYVSCVVLSQKSNGYLRSGHYENFTANKQLATYRFACLLGLESMVPAVWESRFSDGERERVGTMMDKAEGAPPSEVLPKDRENYVKETFLRDLTNLEYFDALCYQLDHRLDNYYVTKNEHGSFAHVVAFDNDALRTFFVIPNLPKRTYADATCVLSNDGTVMRPYMDKEFSDKLLSLSKTDVKHTLGEYLSSVQRYCLNQRIKKLQNAVKKTAEQRADFLVSDWNTVDVQSAADLRWGKTYLHLYLNDTLMLDREKQFEDMKKQS